jgi:O-antigen/teichoic acid export membrane protein
MAFVGDVRTLSGEECLHGRALSRIWQDHGMKSQLSNAVYGVLDYLAYPVGMLIVAPIALRNLGIAQFGVWMIATAAVSTGSIIASGFGDANIRYVSLSRGKDDSTGLLRTVRSTMGIHLVLGMAIALVCWILAPLAAARIGSASFNLYFQSLWSLRIASVIMLVRAVESVCISTLRAFEQYGAAVRYSIIARLLALGAAAALPLAREGVISLMIATAILTVLGLGMQIRQLRQKLQTTSLWPSFDRESTRALLGFGIFAWIQAVSGVLFGQVDRLITGVYFGAAAVTSYALCVQMAQPIYGIAASGLHFLFPHLSARRADGATESLRRTILFAFGANLLMVSISATILLVFGARLLTLWTGEPVAQAGRSVLPLIVCSTAAQGLGVAGSYAMLALGRVRLVTLLNLAGGAAMMLSTPWLLPNYGIHGMAISRLFYGPLTLLVYIPLAGMLFRKSVVISSAETSIAICEEI